MKLSNVRFALYLLTILSALVLGLGACGDTGEGPDGLGAGGLAEGGSGGPGTGGTGDPGAGGTGGPGAGGTGGPGAGGSGGPGAGGTGGPGGGGSGGPGTGGTGGPGAGGTGGPGTGGSGGGGERPCTPASYEDPACVACVEAAIATCEEVAQQECIAEVGSMLVCAGINGCGTASDLDFACLFDNCSEPSEAALRCVVENCEAMAACIRFD